MWSDGRGSAPAAPARAIPPPSPPAEEHIDYLVEALIVTPNMKPWIDQIRKVGNGANHELVHSSQKEAEEILTFRAMLLRLVYEYPKRLEASVPTD